MKIKSELRRSDIVECVAPKELNIIVVDAATNIRSSGAVQTSSLASL
jgi:hypothetical protein